MIEINTPAIVDADHRIYRFAAGAGALLALRERGMDVHRCRGDVADLYEGTTPPGCYRTCNAKGLFQLGGAPYGELTVVAVR